MPPGRRHPQPGTDARRALRRCARRWGPGTAPGGERRRQRVLCGPACSGVATRWERRLRARRSRGPTSDLAGSCPRVALARVPPRIRHTGRLPVLERPLLRTIRCNSCMPPVFVRIANTRVFSFQAREDLHHVWTRNLDFRRTNTIRRGFADPGAACSAAKIARCSGDKLADAPEGRGQLRRVGNQETNDFRAGYRGHRGWRVCVGEDVEKDECVATSTRIALVPPIEVLPIILVRRVVVSRLCFPVEGLVVHLRLTRAPLRSQYLEDRPHKDVAMSSRTARTPEDLVGEGLFHRIRGEIMGQPTVGTVKN